MVCPIIATVSIAKEGITYYLPTGTGGPCIHTGESNKQTDMPTNAQEILTRNISSRRAKLCSVHAVDLMVALD